MSFAAKAQPSTPKQEGEIDPLAFCQKFVYTFLTGAEP
jgi:hypothetical protein